MPGILASIAIRLGFRSGGPRPLDVDGLLARLASKDPAARADAARLLAPSPEPEESPELYAAAGRLAPALERAAEDPDPNVRKRAAWGLAGLVRNGHVPAERGIPLLGRLLEDEDATVRTYAAFAFEKVGAPGAVAISSLTVHAKQDPKRDVRVAAAAALRALRRYASA